jgi:predicted MFS family arabinose efflux permease
MRDASDSGQAAGIESARVRRLRWAVFALASAAFWLSFFHRVSPAAIAMELQASFGIGATMLGTLAATYYLVYTAMQLPTGVLSDTLGPRRVLTAGCVISGIGSLLFGAADTISAALAGRTLVGLGVSVAFVSMLKLNANWFHERRFATATGLGGFIGLTGALAAATPLAWLVARVSWNSIFIALGCVSFALAAAIWIVVRDEPSGHSITVAKTRPEESLERWYHGLARVARNPATWPGFWVCFGMSGSYMTFVGLWAVPYLIHAHGMSSVEATQHTSLMVISLAVTQAGVGAVSDRLGRRRPLMLASALLYFACWIAWLGGAAAVSGVSYVISVLMGACLSGFTLAWACAKELNPPRYSGMAISLVNTGGFLAVGLLQPAVGWLIDWRAGGAPLAAAHFLPGMALLAGFALIGIVAAWCMRETHCRNIWVSENPRKIA